MPAKAGKKEAEDERILAREPIVPKDVVYKRAGLDVNRRALGKLRDVFLAAGNKDASEVLFSTKLICGPGLWRNIKDEPEMRKIKEGVTLIKEQSLDGVQTLVGKLFQGAPEVKAFWTVFLRKYQFDARTLIRRPTPRELSLYWAMIPYDIEEPIFVVDGKRARILVHFVAKDEKIMWIDDYWDVAFDRDPLRESAKRGRDFLVGLVDASVNLLPEHRASKTYWLYHDNYLAAKAIEERHPEVAERIRKAIQSYGVQKSGKIEILFDEANQPLPFRHYRLTEVRRLDAKVVKTEEVTDQVMDGWEKYADLLLLASIALADSDTPKATEHFRSALQMWDGVGFKDRVFEKQKRYATYKLALALIAAIKLGERPPTRDAILKRLLSQQSKDGGWITDYDASGKPVGLANVETTSLAVLALDAVAK
jgi:hypothetical protein